MVLFILMLLTGAAFTVALMLLNAFPPGIVGALSGVLVALLLLCIFLFGRKKKGLRIFGVVLAAIFLAVFGMGTYYLGTTYAMFNKISASYDSESSSSGLDVTQDSFNIYITGIDQWSTEKGLDLERSDVNMIVTVCPKTRKILLTSIPRDTYVPLHRTGTMDKITHTGIYGVDETLNTVRDWLGIDLNYYVKMNFTACVAVINAMDGIDVYSPVEFTPVKMPDWTVQKGINHMTGRQALAFARERKAFEGEDSIRVENQQRVVEAILEKMMSSSTLLTKYGDILAAASDNMSTDMPTSDMQALVKMQIADLGGWDIETQKITGEYEMDYVASMAPTSQYLVYKPDAKSVQDVLAKIKSTAEPTEEEIEAVIKEKQQNYLQGLIDRLLHRN